MNILAWAVLGILAGAIARAIYPGHQRLGLLGTMALGIVGAFVGGILHSLVSSGTLAFAGASLSLGGVVISVLGAIVSLFIYYAATRPSTY